MSFNKYNFIPFLPLHVPVCANKMFDIFGRNRAKISNDER